jgi:hypothetical protein
MERVTPKWKQVAVALGFNGSRIEAIEMGALRQPEDACLKMFSDWLAGGHDLRPPTWDVLIQSLRAAKLPEIVDLLKFIEIVSITMKDIMLASIGPYILYPYILHLEIPCYLKTCRQWCRHGGACVYPSTLCMIV